VGAENATTDWAFAVAAEPLAAFPVEGAEEELVEPLAAESLLWPLHAARRMSTTLRAARLRLMNCMQEAPISCLAVMIDSTSGRLKLSAQHDVSPIGYKCPLVVGIKRSNLPAVDLLGEFGGLLVAHLN